MTQDQALTFLIIAVTVGLFIWNKWRYDIVALASLFAAVLVGIVPGEKAFAGFADPVVVTVACILVLSAAISQSGFIDVALKVMNRFVEYKNLQIFVLGCNGNGFVRFHEQCRRAGHLPSHRYYVCAQIGKEALRTFDADFLCFAAWRFDHAHRHAAESDDLQYP